MSLNRAHLAKDARAYQASVAAKQKNLVPPITFTNATMAGVYSGNKMQSPRAEADDNLSYRSLGAHTYGRAV